MSLLDAKKDIFHNYFFRMRILKFVKKFLKEYPQDKLMKEKLHKLGDLAQKALFQWELIELEVLNNE